MRGATRTAVSSILALSLGPMALAAGAGPTFSKDVAPILYRKCVTCHRPGEVTPMPLIAYDDARVWATAIKQKVVAREMPPWFADSAGSVKFRNDPRLSQKEIDTIRQWVEAGAPRGNDADLPPAPAFATGWHHPSGREPDYVVEMPQEFEAPASGKIVYQNFFVKVPFTTDMWVEAVEARPGNRALVHHFAVSEVEAIKLKSAANPGSNASDTVGPDAARLQAQLLERGALQAPHTPDQVRLDEIRATANVSAALSTKAVDMLAVYVPGQGFQQYPSGVARRLRTGPNMYFNFNLHYTTTGKPERDRSMVGLWFARSAVKSELISLNGAAETLRVQGKEIVSDPLGVKLIPDIPPHAENFEVIGSKTYTDPIVIYNLMPHAHLRGKDWKYVVVYPDGHEQTILTIPMYNPHWQLVYDLETPLRLPAGSRLVVTAHYDNSAKNAHNPAPEKAVLWADQLWDEMFIPFISFTLGAISK
jgi:hypothetical protein